MDLLSENERNAKLKELKDWNFLNDHIEKEFKLKDFRSALNFINKIGEEAEKINHHPDIFLHSYNKVKITLSTHSAGGVTKNDLNLAKKIDGFS